MKVVTRLAYAVAATYYKQTEFTKDMGAACIYCGKTHYHSTDIKHIHGCIAKVALDLVEEHKAKLKEETSEHVTIHRHKIE